MTEKVSRTRYYRKDRAAFDEDKKCYFKIRNRESDVLEYAGYAGLHRVLHFACHEGDLDVVKRIVSSFRGNDLKVLINKPHETYGNSTPLIVSGSKELIEYLLANGADTWARSNGQEEVWLNSAYHWNARELRVDLLEVLLKHNPAGVLIRNIKGETPLILLNESIKHKKQSLVNTYGESEYNQRLKATSDLLRNYEAICASHRIGICSELASDVKETVKPNILQLMECESCQDFHGWSTFLKNWASSQALMRNSQMRDEIQRLTSQIKEYQEQLELRSQVSSVDVEKERMKSRIETLEAANSILQNKVTHLESTSERSERGDEFPSSPRFSEPELSKDDIFERSESETEEGYIKRLRGLWNSSLGPARIALNPSLKNLSKSLYPSSLHFVEEMIQNADDGKASECSVVITKTFICFANNGDTITFDGVRAMCNVGDSSKERGGHSGTIGHKGLGWKSVFAATNSPYLISGGWSFGFRQGRDMVESMLSPLWASEWFAKESAVSGISRASFECIIEDLRKKDEKYNTFIFLPLDGTQLSRSIRKHLERTFQEEASILLLRSVVSIRFLDLSGEIKQTIQGDTCTYSILKTCSAEEDLGASIANNTEILTQSSDTKSSSEGLTHDTDSAHALDHSRTKLLLNISGIKYQTFTTTYVLNGIEETESWWMIKSNCRLVDAQMDNSIPVDNRLKKGLTDDDAHQQKETDIIMCFPLNEDLSQRFLVHAFLPVEGCRTGGGFSFLLHADWNVTAGRDSIEEDDGGWNYALQVATAELISFIAHQYLRDPSRKIVEHLKLTFNRNQGSTISEWWRAFIKRIKESVTVKCNCYQISEETERELVSIFPSYSQDLNLFTISNQEAGLRKLDLLEVLRLYQPEFFDQHRENQEWWASLFASLHRYRIKNNGMATREEIIEVFKTKRILKCYGCPDRVPWRFDGEVIYLLWTEDANVVGILDQNLLPYLRIVLYESDAEKKFLESMGLKEATIQEIVRLLFLGHVTGSDSHSKESLSKSIPFLLANRDTLISVVAQEEAQKHVDARATTKSVPCNPRIPVLYVPVTEGVILSSDAVIPSLTGPESTLRGDSRGVRKDLFEGRSDLDKVKMVVFLMEIGCSVSEDVSDSRELFLGWDDQLSEILKLVFSKSKSQDGKGSSSLSMLRTIHREWVHQESDLFLTFLDKVHASLKDSSQALHDTIKSDKDYLAEEQTKRKVGAQAEAIAFDWLKSQAAQCQCTPVVDDDWISLRDDKAGYDVHNVDGGVFSPDLKGRRCCIEIKHISDPGSPQFYMSSHELEVMLGKEDGEYLVVLVSGVDLRKKNSGSVHGWLKKSDFEDKVSPSQYRVDVAGAVVRKVDLSVPLVASAVTEAGRCCSRHCRLIEF